MSKKGIIAIDKPLECCADKPLRMVSCQAVGLPNPLAPNRVTPGIQSSWWCEGCNKGFLSQEPINTTTNPNKEEN